jgi:hypothetical protein
MAIDVSPPPAPAEQRLFIRQNLISGIYTPPLYDSIKTNIYQDVAISWIRNNAYLTMATGVNIVLDYAFEFGAFCNYSLQNISIPASKSGIADNSILLTTYFYCGNMVAYVPLADKMFHPKIWLDVGLGSAQGSTSNVFSKAPGSVSYLFFVVKPAIALEMNLVSFLQWTLAAQYRLQFNISGPSNDMGTKASGFEVSTGPVFHF